MDKRTVSFLFSAAVTLLVFASLNRMLFPPPPVDEVAVANEATETEANENATDDQSENVDSNVDEPADPSDGEITSDAQTLSTLASQQRGTMGSLDPESGFNILSTWNNRGGSIERIELNGPKYTSIEDRYGYLGHLALTGRTQGGCVVGVVGDGTPAAHATSAADDYTGLQPGDIVRSINGTTTDDPAAFNKVLESTAAGDVATIVVERPTGDSLKNITFSVTLTERPLEIVRPEPAFPSESSPQHPLSYLLEISQLGSRTIGTGKNTIAGVPNLSEAYWDAETSVDGARQITEFTYVLGNEVLEKIGYSGSVEIVKRFTLSPASSPGAADGYHLELEVELRNKSDTTLDIGYRLMGPTGLPYEGWWYAYKVQPKSFGGAGIRDIVYRFDGPHKMMPNPDIVKHATKNPDSPGLSILEGGAKPLSYVGVDAQYFSSTLVPMRPDSADSLAGFQFRDFTCSVAGEVSEERKNKTDVTFSLDSVPEPVAANGSFSQSFKIFAGPKKPDVLAEYGLEQVITYGWFAPIAKGLTAVLHFFYGLIGNYGIAIVCLTVLVRGCLLPFGRKQAMNAARMQELSPEIKKINEKYKDDMAKRSEAQRELFRKNNYNPLSGCLPMFLQLPIFVGLYRALSVDIELRLAPFIPGLQWCSNLAAPDQLFRWDGFMPQFLAGMNGFLGPYFNILPLFSVALMIVHQKLFAPPPTDEQQEMQMKMMKYMMVIFGFMFFRVPAGLCIYFITSSLWAVGERKLLPKPQPKAPVAPETTEEASKQSKKKSTVRPYSTSSRKNENSLLTKLQDAIDQKQNPQSPRANGAARKKERDQQRKKKRKK